MAAARAILRKDLPAPDWWMWQPYRFQLFLPYLKIAGLAPVADILDAGARAYAFSPNQLSGQWRGSRAYRDFAAMAHSLHGTSDIFRDIASTATRSLAFHPKAEEIQHPHASFHIPFRANKDWCAKYGVDYTTALFVTIVITNSGGGADLGPIYSRATNDWFDYARATVQMLCMANDLLKRVAFSINTTKLLRPLLPFKPMEFINRIDHRKLILAALRPELTEHLFGSFEDASKEDIANVVPVTAITKRLTSSEITLILRVFEGALLLRDIEDSNYEPYIRLG